MYFMILSWWYDRRRSMGIILQREMRSNCARWQQQPHLLLLLLLPPLALSGFVLLLAPVGRHLILQAEAVISRDDFPAAFIFGAGTSAYQVEGAAAEDGRSPSIWDTFTHAGRTMDQSTGDVAADQYHKYKEDVKLMHDMGLDAYRFSISWSRLIPNGRGPVNPKGLQYYNDLIDELKRHGIEPHVTLLHFDLPQALEDEYGGLLSPKIVEDFTAYANVCFSEFGERVKYWATFNEPNVQPVLGNDVGVFAPGRCSPPSPFRIRCSLGNSSTEPYAAAHHFLLAHASAVSLYRQNYQAKQGGYIGITLLAMWFEPSTSSSEDVQAQKRALDFHIGWFVEPIVQGNYPAVMEEIVGARLPRFREEESEMLKGSFDFIGLNHYGVLFLQAAPHDQLDANKRDYLTDLGVLPVIPTRTVQFVKDFRGPPPIPATPWALQRLLEYMKVTYGNPPIMIHENGYGEFDIDLTSNAHEYNDDARATFIEKYLNALLLSIRNGSNTQGYFVWSLVDCFELASGYKSRYGIIGVDYSSENRTRTPRYSAKWYSNFLHATGLLSGKSMYSREIMQVQ